MNTKLRYFLFRCCYQLYHYTCSWYTVVLCWGQCVSQCTLQTMCRYGVACIICSKAVPYFLRLAFAYIMIITKASSIKVTFTLVTRVMIRAYALLPNYLPNYLPKPYLPNLGTYKSLPITHWLLLCISVISASSDFKRAYSISSYKQQPA